MDEQIKNRLTHIYWSINLYNTSISELKIISDEIYTSDEMNIVNSHTFDFYRVTLKYCFIMEYCKLLETGSSRNEQNISSLNRLNEILNADNSKAFMELYVENLQLIKEMKSSRFYDKIKNLRDKKFGHADNDEINKPFTINGFNKEDFANAFNHLQKIKIILNNFGSIDSTQYNLAIPSRDDRTRNFIKFQAEYQSYYFHNYLQ